MQTSAVAIVNEAIEHVTKYDNVSVYPITTMAQLNSVPSDMFCFGRRSYWRIQHRSGFSQNPETGTVVRVSYNLPELVRLAAAPATGGRANGLPIRCYNPGMLPKEVTDCIAQMGLTFDSSNRLTGSITLPETKPSEPEHVSAVDRVNLLKQSKEETLKLAASFDDQIAEAELAAQAEAAAELAEMERQDAEREAKRASLKAITGRKAITAKDLTPKTAA